MPFCILTELPIIIFLTGDDLISVPSFMGRSKDIQHVLSDSELMVSLAQRFVKPAILGVISGIVTAAVFFIVFRKKELKGIKTVTLCIAVFCITTVIAAIIRNADALHYGRLAYYPSWSIVGNYRELNASLMTINSFIIIQIGIIITFVSWIANIAIEKHKSNLPERMPS